MKRALELALGGWGRVAPNPLVGAVILRGGKIIGEGYHTEFGQPHAEVEALATCDDPRGATCVVNLEPCRHIGKTPSCADALIRSGVRRVVAAIQDPTTEGGGGLDRLREAGVDVSLGDSAEEAAILNAPFLFSAVRPDRPFVALKLATSLDGLLADESGRSQWISGPEARAFVHWLRAGYDAIGVGRGTAVADDPLLTVRGPLEPRIAPTRVIFTREAELPDTLKMFDTGAAPVVIVVSHSRVEECSETLMNKGLTVLGADTLAEALGGLGRVGVRSILVEGGGRLATSLLDQDLVDRVYWIQAPRWLGRGASAFGSRAAVSVDAAQSWPVAERRALGQDTLLVVDRRLCLQA